MKIRFIHQTTLRLNVQPGDEISIQHATPELEALLLATRLDGEKIAHVVADDDEEVADAISRDTETATVGRGSRHAQRRTPLSQ